MARLSGHIPRKITIAIGLALAAGLIVAAAGRADVAPPEKPPGANLVPGSETTQVRMMAETVVLEVLKNPAAGKLGQARVTADFEMRNLGSDEEKLDVRFPLSFWNGASDGFGRFPEIGEVQVWVNDRPAGTRRVLVPDPPEEDRTSLPWAVFKVTFPPDKKVMIRVAYTATAFGDLPNMAFGYILNTGAGWKDTIGKADLIVRLPYEANAQNVLLEDWTSGFSTTTPGSRIEGHELRWHYENFEPDREDDLQVTLVMPTAWRKVLDERARVERNPTDGEAWGRLGKAIKEILWLHHGMREDAGGLELYAESIAAYEKAVTLLPEDTLWHYGFADLLWSHFYLQTYLAGSSDMSELVWAEKELELSLELDPENERALELAGYISGVPGAIAQEGETIDYLALTATPLPMQFPYPSETPLPPSPTAVPDTPAPIPMATTAAKATSMPAAPEAADAAAQPTPAAQMQPSATSIAALPTSTPTAGIQPRARLPFCASPLALLAAGALVWRRRPRR